MLSAVVEVVSFSVGKLSDFHDTIFLVSSSIFKV